MTVTTILGIFQHLEDIVVKLVSSEKISIANDLREDLTFVIDYLSAGGNADDLSSEQLARVRVIVDTIAQAGAATAIGFIVGSAGVTIAVGGGLFFVGLVGGLVVERILSLTGITLVPDNIDFSDSTVGMEIFGQNSLIGGDTIKGSLHDDTINAYGGGDSIIANGGSDQILGGSGWDTVDYSQSESAIQIEIADGIIVVQHASGTDSIDSVEVIDGTSFNDTLNLDSYGAGSAPDISFDGGDGDDTIFLDPTWQGGATVALESGYMHYVGGAAYIAENFENVIATAGNDTVVGSRTSNILYMDTGHDSVAGGRGNDTISIDLDNNDSISGGEGYDVLVNLGGAATLDASNTGIEVFIGGSSAEEVKTNGATTRAFSGGGGNDTFRIATSGTAPTIIWGGEGDDIISLERPEESADAVGILVVKAEGLTEENFHLFDLDLLGFGASFDWSQIDVVLLNPDSNDTILINDKKVATQSYDPFGAPSAVYTYVGPENEDGALAIAGTTSVDFLGGGSRTIFTGVARPVIELHTEYITEDDEEEEIHFLDVEWYPTESGEWEGTFGTLTLESVEEAGEWDTPQGESLERRTVAWYWGDVLFDIESRENISEWFIVGGSMDGTSIVNSNSITITMPEPEDPSDPEDNPRGGSYGYSPDATNLTGDEGTRHITGYDAARDAVVIDGTVINAQTLGGDITARETSLGTIIAYGADDNVVLRGVTLAQWQAGAASQVQGSNAAELVNGTGNADVIVAGGGNDTIAAGFGDDLINYTSGDDVIIGNATKNRGLDTLDLGRFKAANVHFSISGWDVLVATPDGVIRLEYQVRYETGHLESNIESILFSDGSLDEAGIRARAIFDQSTSGNDSITGTAYGDVINGQAGDDTIIGGAGNDVIIYTSGNDLVVGSANTTLNRGMDTLDLSMYQASDVQFTVSGWDVLITTPDGQIRLEYQIRQAVGHADSNIETILFSDGTLDEAGISARATSDQASSGNDSITGTAYVDTINGLAGNDTINGFGGNDTLLGGDGDDSLDGGTGVDSLIGGGGNDTYVVDVAGDVLVELGSEGTDLVKSAVSWTLADHFEFLTLTGSSAINGTGNGIANSLTGNTVANTLSGLGGNDTIIGGGGNDTLLGGDGDDSLDGGTGTDSLTGGIGDDTFVVDVTTDVVIEAANEGTDTVLSSVAWTLGANVERLIQTGTAAIAGTGNALANSLTGNGVANTLSGLDGNDTLIGGGGNDNLTGGNGADSFVFNSTASGTDTITDFNELNGGGEEGDLLRFDGLLTGTFVYLGTGAFSGGSDNSEARISGSQVLVDTDGNGTADITVILTGLTAASQLATTDFLFV